MELSEKPCPICGELLLEQEVDGKKSYACNLHGNMTEAFEEESE